MSTSLFDLTGEITLVTDASRGIGEETAKLLAEQGAHVIMSDRKLADCEVVAERIREAGDKAEALACHIRHMEDIAAAFNTIHRAHDRLDILISSTAANLHFDHTLDTNLTACEKTVEVNIHSYFFMLIEADRIMKTQGGGTIVNTTSVSALHPSDKQGIYSITKTAVAHMTRAFAKERGPFGIRVDALLPGLTKTKFAGALFEDRATYDRWISEIPLRRHAEPREMAGTAFYPISDTTSYTSGECIVVDDGMTI